MINFFTFKRSTGIPLPAVCLILVGCVPWHSDPLTYSRSPNGLTIQDNGRAQYSCENEELSFTGYSSSETEFIDQFGIIRKERSFGLWIAKSGVQEPHLFYTVYEGLTIYYYSYRFYDFFVSYDATSLSFEVDCGEAI
jgi:hypothetical protein